MHDIDPGRASKNAWGLIKPYWVSEAKGRGYALLSAVVALDLISVGLLVVFTQLRKVIYDGLEKYQQDAFMMGVAQFFGAACIFIALTVYKLYLRQALEIHCRHCKPGQFLGRALWGGALPTDSARLAASDCESASAFVNGTRKMAPFEAGPTLATLDRKKRALTLTEPHATLFGLLLSRPGPRYPTG